MKLKYLADNDFADLSGDELKAAIKNYIQEKDEKAENLKGTMVTQGTTPRRLTDLLGSLADLPPVREIKVRLLSISRGILTIIQKNSGNETPGLYLLSDRILVFFQYPAYFILSIHILLLR